LATLLGAKLLVEGAIELAAAAGISETVVGLTVVAVGTSLPELTVSLVAAFRREADVAFGNIVGSNIYNVLGILGITALVTPITVPPEIIAFDIWVMLGATTCSSPSPSPAGASTASKALFCSLGTVPT
jgi:cation:H+ antiporter